MADQLAPGRVLCVAIGGPGGAGAAESPKMQRRDLGLAQEK